MVTGASKRRREEDVASSVPTVEVPETDMVPQETHASLLVVVVTSLAARGETEEETSAEEAWTPECMVKTSMMDGRLD